MKYNACYKCKKSLGWINVGGNSFIAMVKMFLGFIGGSTALFADGIHSFGDVLGSLVMLVSLGIAEKPKDSKYPYGYGKVEFFAAIIIYVSLFFVGLYILYTAVQYLIHNVPVNPDMVTILGALISLVANEMMYRQSICCGTQLQSPSIIANAHEKRADALSSVVVLVGIIGSKLGFHFLDPVAALLVSFFIFRLCFESITAAVRSLMDGSLSEEAHQAIDGVFKSYQALEVSQIRSREVGQHVSIEIDIRVSAQTILEDLGPLREKISQQVLQAVERPGEVLMYFFPQAGK